MTVYVDPVQSYPGKGQWCHMASDSDDLAELHGMASRIGLQRSWFQNKPTHPHYDLRPSKRLLAVRAGAVEVTAVELVKKCSLLFRGATTP